MDGDLMNIDELLDKYGKSIYSFCMCLTRNKDKADDLYQDTMLKAYNKLNQLDESSNIQAYICGIALRLWKNHERKFAWRQRIAPEVNLDSNGSIELIKVCSYSEEGLSSVIKKEKHTQLNNAINELPEKLRIVILLHYMENLTVLEIANVLGIPKGTVLSRLFKAREQLKEKLEVYFYD